MDSHSQCAADFANCLCTAREILIDFTRDLRKLPEVKSVTSAVECRRPLSDSWIELYVSAGYYDESTLDWVCEIRWNDERWWIERQIRRGEANEDGDHCLIGFPTQEVEDLKSLVEGITSGVRELVNATI